MAQPSTKQLLDAGHSTEYFWYAQGTGLFDARNNAMLTKTGSAGMATEGGANVVLGDGATHYSLPAAISTAQPWTIIFKARIDSATGTDCMVCGDTVTGNDFVRFIQDTGQVRILANGAQVSWTSQTFNALATWALVSSGTTVTLYKDGVEQGSAQSIGASAPLKLTRLLDGYPGGGFRLKGSVEFVNIIPSALDATAIAARSSDPYAVLAGASGASSAISATTTNAVFSGNSKASPKALVSATTANATFAGNASQTIRALIAATIGGLSFSGNASGSLTAGTITTEAFKNNTGTVLSGLTVDKVWAIPFTSPTFFNVVTNGSGVLSVSGGGMVAGTEYLLISSDAAGATVGVKKYTAT